MRVAIPCETYSLDAPISMNFGRSRYLCIFENGELKAIENPGYSAARRAGVMAANKISQLNVDAVIVKQIGPNASRVLQMSGIRIIQTSANTIREALRELGLI